MTKNAKVSFQHGSTRVWYGLGFCLRHKLEERKDIELATVLVRLMAGLGLKFRRFLGSSLQEGIGLNRAGPDGIWMFGFEAYRCGNFGRIWQGMKAD